jgi:hypothetical protein
MTALLLTDVFLGLFTTAEPQHPLQRFPKPTVLKSLLDGAGIRT